MSRKKRSNRLVPQHINALHLFITGGLVIPAFLFQQSLVIRVALVLCYAGLARLAGKKIKWLYFVIMVASITFFNLVSPLGELLVQVGPFMITQGALREGLTKGFTVVGLVFISLFSIRPDLQLPGRLGGLIGRVFYYFERIIDGKRRIEPRRLIASIDTVLEELYVPGSRAETGVHAQVATDRLGVLFMAAVILPNWALLVLPLGPPGLEFLSL
jgi:heptaprenyl diphosphate synthase